MLLCLESFVKQLRDPCPLKRCRWLSPQMPSEAVQSFRPPWKRPQLSRNALRVIPEQGRGLASPSFPSRHLPEAAWPPPRNPGTATASALQGPPFPAAQKPPRVPQAWGLLRLGRCPPNHPRQQDRARSQRRRTRAGRLAALTSGPGSTARSQGDLGSVRLKATVSSSEAWGQHRAGKAREGPPALRPLGTPVPPPLRVHALPRSVRAGSAGQVGLVPH